jgi:hypothetical protein
MPDSEIIAGLRNHYRSEAEAGFPRLQRVPQTKIIQFLDYFAALDPADREALLDALALRGETLFFPGRDRTFPSAPAFDRYWKAATTPGPFWGGFRYTDVKMLSALAKCPEEEGLGMVRQNASGLALQPRPDLLPDMSQLRPAKAPLLRKLVDAALKRSGFARDKGATRGELKYDAPSGASIRLDFGSYMGQLCYTVTTPAAPVRVARLSYEMLWGQPGGWDYLTEDNAERAIELLPELIGCVVDLAEQMNGRTAG